MGAQKILDAKEKTELKSNTGVILTLDSKICYKDIVIK